MKEISIGYGRKAKELKITFPGGIVHITTGLHARHGRDVTHVSVTADGDRFAGEPEYWAKGKLDKTGAGILIIRLLDSDKPGGAPRGAA